jgi:hypothetical protein
MVKKLSYLLLASATAVSFSAIAGGNQKQSQGQSDQTQAQSGQSSQSNQSPDTVKQAQEKLTELSERQREQPFGGERRFLALLVIRADRGA